MLGKRAAQRQHEILKEINDQTRYTAMMKSQMTTAT